MKILTAILSCIACGLAFADDAAETDSEEFDEVQIRLVAFEQIDVTADKPPAESAEPLSDEIEDILRDAEALEADDND